LSFFVIVLRTSLSSSDSRTMNFFVTIHLRGPSTTQCRTVPGPKGENL
jgi:hypothetical protein